MYLISTEGYKNAYVYHLIARKTGNNSRKCYGR